MIISKDIHMSFKQLKLDSIGHILITSVVFQHGRSFNCGSELIAVSPTPLLPPRCQVLALEFF